MDRLLFDSKIEVFKNSDDFTAEEVGSANVSIKIDSDTLVLSLSVDLETNEFSLTKESASNTDTEVFTIQDDLQRFPSNLMGLTPQKNLDLKEVRIEIRPRPKNGRFDQYTPYCSLILCWDVSASASENVSLPSGDIDIDASATVRICAGLAAMYPPSEGIGLSNFLVCFDLESFGIGSGWMPLSAFYPGFQSDFDMAPLLAWFKDIVTEWDVPPSWKKGWEWSKIIWNFDFPNQISVPLGLRFRKSRLQLRQNANDQSDAPPLYVNVLIEGVEVNWGPFEFSDDKFKLSLEWLEEEKKYKFNAVFSDLFYPTSDSSEPLNISLPFKLLKASAACARLRLGLFTSVNNAKQPPTRSLCFETLIEIGGFSLSSELSSGSEKSLYETDLRLLLRNLSVIADDVPDKLNVKFFDGIDETLPEIFKNYQKCIPAYSFAKNLNDSSEPDSPNDYGLYFLDGDFRAGERIFLAWEQRGNQLLRALAHDLLGKSPAGKVPEEAEIIHAAMEIAWFDGAEDGKETQIRVDWQPKDAPNAASATESPALLTQADTVVTTTLSTVPEESCCNLPSLATARGIQIPEQEQLDTDGNPIDPKFNFEATVPDPMSLDLPGIRLSLQKPEAQGIVYRSEADGSDSVAYLLHWFENSIPQAKSNKALVRVAVGFATTCDGGKRQVQGVSADGKGGDEPFLQAVLGYNDNKHPVSLQVVRLRSGHSPKFLQVYDDTAPRLARLIPASSKSGIDSCPEPGMPAVVPVALGEEYFRSFSLSKDGPWRLAIHSKLTEAVLNMFGSSESRRVTVELTKICLPPENNYIRLHTSVVIKLSSDPNALSLDGEVRFRFDLRDLSLTVDDGVQISLDVPEIDGLPLWAKALNPEGKTSDYDYTKDYDFFGFKLVGIRKEEKKEEKSNSNPISLLSLTIEDGRFVLAVPEKTFLLLRYEELGDDGLTFLISEFELGAGGLDLSAALLATTLKLPGLKKPFALNEAALVIRQDRLERLKIAGSGVLPELLNEAPVEISLDLAQDINGRLTYDLDCTLGDGDTPIFSSGTLCYFKLTQITIDYDDADSARERAWYFLISGSLQFDPKGGEFADALLEDFKSIRAEFTNAPLSDEFFDHVELMVVLNTPKRFKIFDLFTMEIRSIGFHPNYQGFAEDSPAIVVGGQCEFADIGDVLSVEIDFHKFYLGLSRDGEVLPQVKFDGLRVEISTSGFKIAGRVDEYDKNLLRGFAGEGTILIPGLPELSAAFSFVKLRADEMSAWKRGWFVAIEASKISYQIGSLPLYLRQVGLGFGYRYTSVIIKRFEQEDRLGSLIALMLKEISNHQTLARIDSWAPDPERDGERGRWSIGLEAVFSMASANSGPTKYNRENEIKLKTVVAQFLMFIRSDLTFLAAAKVWLPVSADDFFEDLEGMRRRPLALGFMIYSAPKSRLLIHAAKGKNPYLGPKDQPIPESVKKILDESHFEATFLSEPGIFHGELGWPDRLFFNFKIGPLTLECRGGILLRAERDLLVQGIYFTARGETDLGGSVSAGIVGVQIVARINVSFATRLMIGMPLSRPIQGNIYAAVGVDVSVRFSVCAWFRLSYKFFSISIDLHFSLNLQIILALELGWAGGSELGFRGRATVMIGVFGHSLGVKVHVGIRESGVNKARAALAPYMRSFMEPGSIPPIPGLNTERLPSSAEQRGVIEVESMATLTTGVRTPVETGETGFLRADKQADAVAETRGDGFVLSMMKGQAGKDGKQLWFGWIMPSPSPKGDTFYPALPGGSTEIGYANLTLPSDAPGRIFKPSIDESGKNVTWEEVNNTLSIELKLKADSNAEWEFGDGSSDRLSLGTLLTACYLPASEENYGSDEAPFPLNWPKNDTFSLKNVTRPKAKVLKDKRILDPDSPARSPRRQLDPDDEFDAALMRATFADSLESNGDAFEGFDSILADNNEKNTNVERQLRDQALGNQAFLIRAFYDDLKYFAKKTRLEDKGNPVALPLPNTKRPTLAHLGLFVCVEAAECPEWLLHYNVDQDKTASLEFNVEHPGAKGNIKFNGPLPPVIDFTTSNFKANSPHFDDIVGYLDDETLNLGWDLKWGPLGIPEGVLWNKSQSLDEAPDPEDFLAEYKIKIYLDGRRDPIHETLAGPGDLLVSEVVDEKDRSNDSEKTPRRLKLRYQCNLTLAELGLDGPRDLSAGLLLTAMITPVAQDGSRGRPYSITIQKQPSATPLPADDALLKVWFKPQTQFSPDKTSMKGLLTWRELVPPNRVDVAVTQRWELVLRPLPQLPLGAYPMEAVDVTDTGLQGEIGLIPRDGDMIISLDDSMAIPYDSDYEYLPGLIEQYGLESASGEAQRPSMLRRRFLHLPTKDLDTDKLKLYDHNGNRIVQDDATGRFAQAVGFFTGIPATEEKGAGWRLFLRASACKLKPEATTLPKGHVSPMIHVRLLLDGQPDLEIDTTTVGTAGKKETSGVMPLDYLEWVTVSQNNDPGQLPASGLAAAQGNVHVAAFLEQKSNELGLTYLPLPGRDRGVTLRWSAVCDDGDKRFAMEDIAAWEIYEARMDALVNADRPENGVPAPGFGPTWVKLREVRPADRAQAQRAATSFVQPEIWDTVTPVDALTIDWMNKAGIPPEAMESQWPGWYSWAESELAWPTLNRDTEAKLILIGRGSTRPPLEEAVLDDLDILDPKAIELALAARRDLGEFLAKRRLHPWLLLVIGAIAAEGAPVTVGGKDNDARFEVEISPGKPVILAEGEEPDPVKWLESDVSEADPTGWGGLSHLGLAVTIALRDPATGLYLPQAEVRKEIEKAVSETEKDYLSKSEKLKSLIMDHRHIAIDLPLQTAWASRSESGEVASILNATLSMVQLSLRPVPVPMQQLLPYKDDIDGEKKLIRNAMGPVRYSVVRIKLKRPDVICLSHDLDCLFPDRIGQVSKSFPRFKKIDLEKFSSGDESIILRWQEDERGNNKLSPLKMLEDAYGEEGISVGKELEELATQPIVLIPSSSDSKLALSPFGRFRTDTDAWESYLCGKDHEKDQETGKKKKIIPNISDQRKAPCFEHFVCYLARAFAVMKETVTGNTAQEKDKNQTVAEKKAFKQMVAKIYATEHLGQKYLIWSARYFSSTPVLYRDSQKKDERPVFHPQRLTATWPKRDDPVRMAPDAQGRLTYTHPVKEDWASLRAYAVRIVPRWWPLCQPNTPVGPPEFGTSAGRVDVAIPRRRPVVAPKLLGVRNITSLEGREFHEITLADHIEQSLSRANQMLARKLEYQDMRRRFTMAFHHTAWLDRLDDAGFVSGKEPCFGDIQPDEQGQWVPAEHDATLNDSAVDFLEHVPMARFGALRLITPAEPYYYDMTMDVMARARHVQSPVTTIRLPQAAAIAPVPHSDPDSGTIPPFSKIEADNWADMDVDGLDKWKQKIKDNLVDDQLKKLIEPFLNPSGHMLKLRFPRLLEALSMVSRGSHHATELEDNSYGRLPDPDARLEIVGEAFGNRTTIAVIERGVIKKELPFVLRNVSNDYWTSPLDIKGCKVWDKGLAIQLNICRKFGPIESLYEGELSQPDVEVEPAVALPSVFVKPQADTHLDPRQMPDRGPLAQLASLLQRLAESTDDGKFQLRQLAELTGPRWLCRSHLPPIDEPVLPELTAMDLEIGIRMLIDVERRRAAVMVGLAKEWSGRNELILSIEEAYGVILSDPLEEGIDLKDLKATVETGGHLLYHLSAGGIWSIVVDAVEAQAGERLLLILAKNDENIVQIFKSIAIPSEPRQPKSRQFESVALLAQTLAKKAHRTPDLNSLVAMAHHSNLPPSNWKDAEKGDTNED